MRRLRVVMIATAIAAGCGRGGPSARAAATALCAMPEFREAHPASRAQRIADWVTANVGAPKVRALFAQLDALAPIERGPALRAAVAQLGVTTCPLADRLTRDHDPSGGRPVPQVAADPSLATPTDGLAVRLDRDAITVDGGVIVQLTDGEVDASDRVGATIGPLARYLVARANAARRAQAGSGPARLLIAADPAVPAARVLDVIRAATAARMIGFGLIVRSGDRTAMIPFELPTASDALTGVGVAVQLRDHAVAQFSLSGQEGTAGAPALTVATDAAGMIALRDHLAALHARRWPAGATAERQLVIMVDARTRVDELIAVVLAARRDGAGVERFSWPVFSMDVTPTDVAPPAGPPRAP